MIPLIVERTYTRFEPSPGGLVVTEAVSEIHGLRTANAFTRAVDAPQALSEAPVRPDDVRMVPMSEIQHELVARAWAEGWPDRGSSEWLGDLAGAWESAKARLVDWLEDGLDITIERVEPRQRVLSVVMRNECGSTVECSAGVSCQCRRTTQDVLEALGIEP